MPVLRGQRWFPRREGGRKMRCHLAWRARARRDALAHLQGLRKRGPGWWLDKEDEKNLPESKRGKKNGGRVWQGHSYVETKKQREAQAGLSGFEDELPQSMGASEAGVLLPDEIGTPG